MKPADRQKMCPNCDGRIPYDATQCPFCFATVQVDNSPSKHQSLQESLTSLYTPPYGSTEEKRPAPERENIAVMEKEESAKIFWPILFLSLAGNLFTLGILQFFFSDHGVVHLEINGSYWFLFLLLSVHLTYFGLKQLKEEIE